MIERSLGSLENCPVPDVFPSPFDLQPHPLAQLAARDLQQHLRSIGASEHDFFAADGGKMFGVLVVQRHSDTSDSSDASDYPLTYLAAFSGMLAGQWLRQSFAPPVFDLVERQQVLGDGESRLQKIGDDIDAIAHSSDRARLQQKLAELTCQQQQALGEAKRRYQQRRQHRHDVRVQLENEVDVVADKPGRSAERDSASMDELALESQRDKAEYKSLKREWDKKLNAAQSALVQGDNAITSLRNKRKVLSRQLQEQLFSGYRLTSYNTPGNSRPVTDFFIDALPPGGTGDCASIKLLNSCYELNLKPVCMAEFWWGAAPPGGVRHHDHFYPACRGKCRPILPHMLDGLNVQPPRYEAAADFPLSEPEVLFEDEHIVILLKPAGMLSVAGKTIADSVESRLQSRYSVPVLNNPVSDKPMPDKKPRMLVHRLDQATSGLMVAAKNAACHKSLHQQFERREVDKRYVAVVNGLISNDSGVVNLPLRVDLNDRPRQMVCHQHGKSATTRYHVLSRTDKQTRLQLFPATGRTHQLRVHLAHTDGLNTPIVGDELYGSTATRLHLHAEQLGFRHPVTGERVEFESPAPF